MSGWFANSRGTHRSQEGRHDYEHRRPVTSGRRHGRKNETHVGRERQLAFKGTLHPKTLWSVVFFIHFCLFWIVLMWDAQFVRDVCLLLNLIELNGTRLVGRKLKMAALVSPSRNRDPVSKKKNSTNLQEQRRIRRFFLLLRNVSVSTSNERLVAVTMWQDVNIIYFLWC